MVVLRVFCILLASQTSAWDEQTRPCLAAPPPLGPPLVNAAFYFVVLAKEVSDTVDGNESASVMYELKATEIRLML